SLCPGTGQHDVGAARAGNRRLITVLFFFAGVVIWSKGGARLPRAWWGPVRPPVVHHPAGGAVRAGGTRHFRLRPARRTGLGRRYAAGVLSRRLSGPG